MERAASPLILGENVETRVSEVSIDNQLKDLIKLQEYIESQVAKRVEATPVEKFRSDDIAELAASLSKAQGEYPIIRYNRETSTYQNEYTDLDLIMRQIRPILSKHNLSFTQVTLFDKDGAELLDSIILHSSGQWMKSRERVIPHKEDKLALISEINSKKRIQAQSILNITVMDDLLDDNLEEANKDYESKMAEGIDINFNYNPKKKALCISKDELKDIQYELKDWPDIAQHLMERLKIETFADMPKDQYRNVVTYIRKTIALRTTPPKSTT